MSETAFDTLEASRRLKGAGIQAEQAEAIVEVVNESACQTVTVERFEAGLAALNARIDSVHAELHARIDSVHAELLARIDSVHVELLARIDSVRSDLRADIFRSLLIAVGILIAANALMMTILGIVLTRGATGI